MRRLALFAVALFLVVTTAGHVGASATLDAGRALIAAAAPVRGEAVSREALSGRPVIVTYFASWCPPCTHEFEALNTIRDRWPEDRVAIVAINVYEDFGGRSNPERMRRFLNRTDPRFAVIEGNEALRTAFGDVTRIPTLIVFDAQGDEVWRFVHETGATKQSATAEEIEAALGRLDGDD